LQDDARFISVDFSKVHSRIAHLVASYVTHSQEVSVAMRLQLLQMLRSLRQLLGDEGGREQHLGCVCGSLLLMLEQAPTSAVHLPDTLKTEELCSAAWETEQGCVCLWDANLSRKTSRRKRTKSLLAAAVQSQSLSQDTAASAPATTGSGTTAMHVSLSLGANSFGTPRAVVVAHPSDDEDEDSDEYDNFVSFKLYYPASHLFKLFNHVNCVLSSSTTVCCRMRAAARTRITSERRQRACRRACPWTWSRPTICSYLGGTPLRFDSSLCVYSMHHSPCRNEPTKRDLDVLKALSNIDVEKETLPHVYAWKTAMESFSSAEMNL